MERTVLTLVNCIIPIIYIILIELLKKINFVKKLNKWVKIGFSAALTSVLIILIYHHFGYSMDFGNGFTSVIAPVNMIILVTGFLVDWRAGVFSIIIPVFYRSFCVPFSQFDILRFPDSLTMIATALIIIFFHRVVFRDVKPHWTTCFFLGVFAEVIDMLLVLMASINYLNYVFTDMSRYDIFTILGTGLIFAISALISRLFNREPLFKHFFRSKELRLKVQKSLFFVTVISFVVAFGATYAINIRKTQIDSNNTLSSSVSDALNQVNSTVDKTNIKNIATGRKIANSGFMVITDQDSEIISISSFVKDPPMYFSVYLNNQEKEIRDLNQGTPIEVIWEKESYSIFYKITDDLNYNVIGLIPMTEIYNNSSVSVRIVCYLLIIIFVIIFVLFDNVIYRHINLNINKINDSLKKITYGELQEEILITDSKEFSELSNDINLTVGALKNYNEEINRRLEEESELARNIQLNSVITNFTTEHAFDIYAQMQIAKEAGGDFYDYIKISNDKVVLLIADVVGNGIVATMYMIRAKTILKTLILSESEKEEEFNLGNVANKLNKELCSNAITKNGVIIWLGCIDLKTGNLSYINANHIGVCIKHEDKFSFFGNKIDKFFGVDSDYHFEVTNYKLNPGEELLFFTDGAFTLRDKEFKFLSNDKFLELVADLKYFNARQLTQLVSDQLNHFSSTSDIEDDITIMAFRYLGYGEVKPGHEITLKAIPNNTPIATKFVESIMQQYHCPPKAQAIILIAVDELFSNIAYYAYKGQPQPGNGTIRIEIEGTEFRLSLIDNGVPFNPLTHLDPTYITDSAEERTNKGGLGIFMVRRTVDDMQYSYEDGQNILTITKVIPEMHEDEFKDSYSTTRE